MFQAHVPFAPPVPRLGRLPPPLKNLIAKITAENVELKNALGLEDHGKVPPELQQPVHAEVDGSAAERLARAAPPIHQTSGRVAQNDHRQLL